MSEVKKRTVQDVQQEYTGLCARAGHLQYQINAMQKDLELINTTLRDLNVEASKFAAEEKIAAETAAKENEVAQNA